MTPDDSSRVWRLVWRVLGEWETDVGRGSARATFDRAWEVALTECQPHSPATRRDREDAWRRWLECGAEGSPSSRAALLEDARGRANQGELFGGPVLRRILREPGQEG